MAEAALAVVVLAVLPLELDVLVVLEVEAAEVAEPA